jgi:hypothetical protein
MRRLMSKKIAWEVFSRSFVVVLGMAILFISVARAGLEILAKDDSNGVLKNDEINYLVAFEDGETAPGIYKLPETGMLPDNAFYGMRKVRDWLWLTFSTGENKLKLAILLTDKGMAEAKELIIKEKYDIAIETGNEAMDKLEYADKLVNGFKVPDEKIKQIHYQIFWAGFAYKEIFKDLSNAFNIDREKYTKLVTRINDWNKEQEKNRFAWNF